MRNLFLSAVITLFAFSVSSAQTSKMDVSILPDNAQKFIEQYFSSETVKKVEKEDGILNMDKSEMYEVHFANGVKLDFNEAGEVTEIESRKDAKLPMKAIPMEILDYVKNNYKNAHVMSWEMDNDEQEVELSDGTDLEFDLKGKFLKED